MVKNRFGGDNVVVAVSRHFRPSLFRHRLVPRQPQLLMVNPEFDFPFLQALLLRREVIHVCVGNIIGVSEHGVLASADNPLTQPIKTFNVIPTVSCIKNVVVIPSTVEPDQLLAEKLSNLGPGRIYHSYDSLAFSSFLPVHKQQIRKDLNIKEYRQITRILRNRTGFNAWKSFRNTNRLRRPFFGF